VRINTGAEPSGRRNLGPDVAFRIADPRAGDPDAVIWREARVLGLPLDQLSIGELVYQPVLRADQVCRIVLIRSFA
jgi:hypothetical protein